MGTDIFLYAEHWHDDRWQFLGTLEPNDEPLTEADASEPALRPTPHYDRRNRALFVLLGLPGGDPFSQQHLPPIAPLRGLPTDLSPELATWAFYWDRELGAGWLRLDEVLAYDWPAARPMTAMVHPADAHWFHDPTAGFPGGRWPPTIPYAGGMRDGVTVQWTETAAETAGAFLSELATSLAAQYHPAMVRFVFWFY